MYHQSADGHGFSGSLKDVDQEDVEETMCDQSWTLATFFMSGVEVELGL